MIANIEEVKIRKESFDISPGETEKNLKHISIYIYIFERISIKFGIWSSVCQNFSDEFNVSAYRCNITYTLCKILTEVYHIPIKLFAAQKLSNPIRNKASSSLRLITFIWNIFLYDVYLTNYYQQNNCVNDLRFSRQGEFSLWFLSFIFRLKYEVSRSYVTTSESRDLIYLCFDAV
jgi:hypothetical protein